MIPFTSINFAFTFYESLTVIICYNLKITQEARSDGTYNLNIES